MANGNGNNINTDDAAAAGGAAAAAATTTAAQGQQHMTGDGNGACGDAKLPATARVGNVNDLVADLWLNGNGSGSGSSSRGDYTNIRATSGTVATMIATAIATAATATPPATSTASSSSAAPTSSTSTSTFSFKHFLNSSGTITAPSSTVTSLDTTAGSSGNNCASSSSTSCNNTNASATSASLQTSTGARPKVPQSASVSHMQPDLNGSAASKMKRSPRFSSFDSQASLAEYAACGGPGSSSSGSRLRPDLRLEVDRGGLVLDDDDDDEHVGLAQVRNSRLYDERVDDDIFPSAASNMHAPASNSRYVPRSYSSYDMPPNAACAAASPRRRPALRPNRLVLSSAPKMKLDLPLDASNVAGAASALPDFVQDHLPDAWCQEAHLNSPPNSPLGAAEAPRCSGAMGGGGGGGGALLLPAAAAAGLPSSSTLSSSGEAAGSTVKMLPDFLSDGPILHSSQRMADVAIGLPSNSIDSPPQEADGGTACTLRQENERLQRELQEMRVELNAQTRRAHEVEQQLVAIGDARRRETLAATAQTQHTQRLRRQVAQLEAELYELRHSSDQQSCGGTASGGASVMTPGSSHSSSSNTARPSRTHQLSRDLLRAADNAEQNLRQLLTGVDNLRQMAANLEQQTAPAATPRSPTSDPYIDFN